MGWRDCSDEVVVVVVACTRSDLMSISSSSQGPVAGVRIFLACARANGRVQAYGEVDVIPHPQLTCPSSTLRGTGSLCCTSRFCQNHLA